jgi:hypothetical protein
MCAIKIGWSKRDISTMEPVNINGQMYLRISEGIHDPIMTTALVLDGGEGQDAAIFVSCDLTSISVELIAEVKEKVAARNAQIPVKNIAINATHTHSSSATWKIADKSPDGRDVYSGDKYRDFATNQIADAVCEAWETRKEGGIAYGYSYAVVAHSRRTIYSEDQGAANPLSPAPNGFGVMYGSTKKASFSHYEAGADHFLNAMFTVDETGKMTGVIVNVPCPSQICEHFTKLSADYWHDVRMAVEAEFGEGVFVLPQCAAAGDLSPRVLHYLGAQARRMELKYDLAYPATSFVCYNKCIAERKDIAERILEGLKDIWSWAKKDIQTNPVVRHSAEDVDIPYRKITEEEKQWCLDNIKALEERLPDPNTCTPEEYRKARTNYESIRNRNLRAVERCDFVKEHPTLDYTIHITQVGEIAFATNPWELYQDYMHRIQARSPFIQTFTIQMAGTEESCYLASERGIANKGYSASLFCNQIGAEGGQQIVEETLAILNEMKAKDEQ